MNSQDKTFKTALDIADLQRRMEDTEKDVKQMKPIVYDTAASVKQIEKSVEKMEENSSKIKGYFMAAAVSGIVGIVVMALQNSIF